jgi:hypothetical protein
LFFAMKRNDVPIQVHGLRRMAWRDAGLQRRGPSLRPAQNS